MRLRRRELPRSPLELAVADDGLVRLDHFCAGAEMHRLLGVELTESERTLLRGGEVVSVVVACDRCIWERRLVVRRAPGSVERSAS